MTEIELTIKQSIKIGLMNNPENFVCPICKHKLGNKKFYHEMNRSRPQPDHIPSEHEDKWYDVNERNLEPLTIKLICYNSGLFK